MPYDRCGAKPCPSVSRPLLLQSTPNIRLKAGSPIIEPYIELSLITSSVSGSRVTVVVCSHQLEPVFSLPVLKTTTKTTPIQPSIYGSFVDDDKVFLSLTRVITQSKAQLVIH